MRPLPTHLGPDQANSIVVTETELFDIAEGRRLHPATRNTLVLFAVWISIHLIFGWSNHWSFYLLLAIAGLGSYFHYRLKALCTILRREREGVRASEGTLESSG